MRRKPKSKSRELMSYYCGDNVMPLNLVMSIEYSMSNKEKGVQPLASRRGVG